jgi:hypothetical protein
MKSHCGPDTASIAIACGFHAARRSFSSVRLAAWKVFGNCDRWGEPNTSTSLAGPEAGPLNALALKSGCQAWAAALPHKVIDSSKAVMRIGVLIGS